MFELRGSKSIVTGGARGFGREFTTRLLSAGGKVVIADVMEDEAKKTVKELGEKYGHDNVTYIKCDVRSDDEWRKLWDEAESFLGGAVTLLVNNAGVAANNGQDNWRRCLDINFMGVAIGTYLALEKMDTSKGGKGGRIVNVASYAGLLTGLGDMNASSYTISKHAVVCLTKCFADRKAKTDKVGVRAYALCPFFANTKLVSDEIDISKLEKMTHVRVLTVEEVGNAFITALHRDSNGTCYGIFPDSPLIEHPYTGNVFVPIFILAGKLIGMLGGPRLASDSSVEQFVLRWPLVFLILFIVLAILFYVLKFALCMFC